MQNIDSFKIGYVSPGWPLSDHPNGIVAYVENMIASLPKEIEANVIVTDMQSRASGQNVYHLSNYSNSNADIPYKVAGKILSAFGLSSQSVEYKRRINGFSRALYNAIADMPDGPDILEVEESFGLAYNAVEKLKIPLVTRMHGPWLIMQNLYNASSTEQNKLRIFYEGELIKNSHGLTSPSLDVLEKVRAHYNLELPNAKVIPNFTSLTSKEKQWVLDEARKSLLFVGRFDSTKGGDLIIDAFNIIAQQDKDVELDFVGPDHGLISNGIKLSIHEYINQFVKDDSIRKRIKFHGHCNSEVISTFRQKANVTVCCSRYENFPVSLLEALSAGCPTVAPAVGGIKEIIIDNKNGFFAEPESVESIAERTLELLNDSEKSVQLSKYAIEDSAKRFAPSVIMKQTVNYYRDILSHY